MAELNERVRAGLDEVRGRIRRAGGDTERVRIVAVTKGFGSEAVEAALEAGCRDIGENYADELIAKVGEDSAARVHFLGPVQRNKIPRLAAVVDVWQGVDREEEALAIASRAPGAELLVQVNLSPPGLEGRAGVQIDAVAGLVERIKEVGPEVLGLMAVGPPPPDDPAPSFRRVAEMARSLGLPEVSMGMSDDLEAAVAAGSTMVRVGKALFGNRPRGRPTGVGDSR